MTENAGLENAGVENAAPDCRGAVPRFPPLQSGAAFSSPAFSVAPYSAFYRILSIR